jgi:dUTP pyrophosphatase
MKVNIKKLTKNAVVPTYAKPGDAGCDLVAVSYKVEIDEFGHELEVYGTGLAFEIPEGYAGLLFPRSSISKKSLSLSNSVGLLDSGFRGEVLFKFRSTKKANEKENIYKIGDRIGQIVIIPFPKIEYTEVEELSETARGLGGYGSTGV